MCGNQRVYKSFVFVCVAGKGVISAFSGCVAAKGVSGNGGLEGRNSIAVGRPRYGGMFEGEEGAGRRFHGTC